MKRSQRERKPNKNIYGEDFVTEKPKKSKLPVSEPEAAAAAEEPPPPPPSANVASRPTSPAPATAPPPSPPPASPAAPSPPPSPPPSPTPTGPLTEEQQIAYVQKLYRDVTFSGAYSGVSNMRKCLLLEKHVRIPVPVIAKALNLFPNYVKVSRHFREFAVKKIMALLQRLPAKTKYPVAHYDVTALGQLVQSDLAFVHDDMIYNGFIGFIILVECFSHRIFTRAIKEKSKPYILGKLDEIFKEADFDVYVLQTDDG
jgi:hypothetical protein